MIKRLSILLVLALFVLTGCQPTKSVDLNKLVMNGSKVTSSEAQLTTSIDFTYNKGKVHDQSLLKVLELINHSKVVINLKNENSSMASLSGQLILQQGTIPFQLYVDQKQMVLLLDNASKPIRIPINQTQGNSQDTNLTQDLQTNLIQPIVQALPNPKHLTITPEKQKIHGTTLSGYQVHEEIYSTEIPDLITGFINNLLSPNKTAALSQIVSELNKIGQLTGDNSSLTPDQLKSGLQTFKTEMDQTVPELKKMNLLSTKNYLKTDLFVSKSLYVYHASTELKLASIPPELGLNLSSLTLKFDSQTWNINGPVKVNLIKASSYLDENASTDQVLATLDKRNSVLYSVITSFSYPSSKPLTKSQVLIKNNKSKPDTLTVKGLSKGDVIRVYETNTSATILAASISKGSAVTLSIHQLGTHAGKVYLSIIRPNKAESSRLEVPFSKEGKTN